MCQIAEMKIEDYDLLIKLWQSDPGIGISKADEKLNLSAFLDKNRGLNFIAVINNDIIGTILCGNDGRRGYLYHVFVLPEFRKKNIGKKLVYTCIEKLKEEHITKCHAMIFNHNITGKTFWEKIGFKFREDIGIMSTDLG